MLALKKKKSALRENSLQLRQKGAGMRKGKLIFENVGGRLNVGREEKRVVPSPTKERRGGGGLSQQKYTLLPCKRKKRKGGEGNGLQLLLEMTER